MCKFDSCMAFYQWNPSPEKHLSETKMTNIASHSITGYSEISVGAKYC